jgi:cytochrome d ubiquinol oxidase subunit I
MIRLAHVVVGAYILSAFFVMSVSAFYIVKNRHLEFARRSFKIALTLAVVSSLVQLALGHYHAIVVAEHQPAKMAAFEGVYKTEESSTLYLFGITSDANEKVYGLGIPGMLSFLIHGDFKTPVTGFDQIPDDEQPPVQLTFQAYHIMIAMGMYFIGITLLAVFLWWRGKLFEQKWLMWIFVFSVIAPYLSNQAGWIAAEVGRQPWIVYGLLKTSDAVSKSITAGQVAGSLTLFLVVYALLFALFIFLLDRKIKAGPDLPESMEHPDQPTGGDLMEAAGRRGKSQYSQMGEKES